jgi:GTP-binding protein
MSFTLAIVGRPNVGKSTLFNRLVGRKLALVDDQPGVTRDLREGQARLGPLRFTVIDSAGLEEATDDSLQGRMRRLTERAVEEADVCLFLIDARQGITPTDEVFADILRRKNAHVILAANKAEGRAGESGYLEAFSLGLGEPIRLSAEHGEGLEDLLGVLMPLAEEFEARDAEAAEQAPETDVDLGWSGEETEDDDAPPPEDWRPTERRPLQIAVVGRPNAGKSTLINRILGEERLLTGPRPASPATPSPSPPPGRARPSASSTRRGCASAPRSRTSSRSSRSPTPCAPCASPRWWWCSSTWTRPFESQDLRIADLAEREGGRW